MSEEPDPARAASPIARVDEVLARYGRSTNPPTVPMRTAGERLSWLDRLNRPSTSRPYERDPPPHQPTPPVWKTATDTPGGIPLIVVINDYSNGAPPPPPPRREGPPEVPSRESPRIPEYIRTHRAPKLSL